MVATDRTAGNDIVVFRVKERSSNLSSGLLSAVRRQPAGRRPPSDAARSTVLGQYQDSITRTICDRVGPGPGPGLNSLYQYVIAASDEAIVWSPHPGDPVPVFLFMRPQGFVLPGIANGPSPQMAALPAWREFMVAIADVCQALGCDREIPMRG